MNDAERPIYRFAGFTLDLGKGRLKGESDEIVLRPKSLDLLAYLVRNATHDTTVVDARFAAFITTIWRAASIR